MEHEALEGEALPSEEPPVLPSEVTMFPEEMEAEALPMMMSEEPALSEVTAEAEPPSCTANQQLRDWVSRWCSGDRAGLAHISTWNTSRVTSMDALFHNQKQFNDDIGAWDTSNVTTMRAMFQGASSFNRPIGDWNVGKVTNMSAMFLFASNFNQPIGGWQVDKVTSMNWMF